MERFSEPRGTHDVLPAEWRVRDHVLAEMREAFDLAGFGRIATPTFEDTGLFARGAGASSDIVRKQMYTFEDQSGRSLTLRPEGTAPVVRAYVRHGMHREPQPVKVWYFEPMFRYEAPQKGRYRQHYQVGAEVMGTADPRADADLIALLAGVYDRLGVPALQLHINSIGDANCRPAYREELVKFLRSVEDLLCEDCRSRIDDNPLRAFDCKQPGCSAAMVDAPLIGDHLCEPCAEHMQIVREGLDLLEVEYVVDPRLVRGLDYYTRTTFEFSCSVLGAQSGIGGGGRYDGLAEELGGPSTPSIGFGSGIERIVLALQEAGEGEILDALDVFVVADEAHRTQALAVAHELREAGLSAEFDLAGRSIKGQLKHASRLGAPCVVLLEGDEMRLREMTGRDEKQTTPQALVHDVKKVMEDQWRIAPTPVAKSD